MLYCSWGMARDRCNYCSSFWAIFCPFTLLTAQKIKIFKKWKKSLKIPSSYICLPKIMIRWCTVPEIWCATNRRMDRQKKWHIEVDASPKKHDPSNINGIHMCFFVFCIKFCIVTIVKWDFFGITIMEN